MINYYDSEIQTIKTRNRLTEIIQMAYSRGIKEGQLVVGTMEIIQKLMDSPIVSKEYLHAILTGIALYYGITGGTDLRSLVGDTMVMLRNADEKRYDDFLKQEGIMSMEDLKKQLGNKYNGFRQNALVKLTNLLYTENDLSRSMTDEEINQMLDDFDE
jgi:hypothetical protein